MTTRRHDIVEGGTVMLEGCPAIFMVEKQQGVFLVLRDLFGQRIPFAEVPEHLPEGVAYSIGELKCHEKLVSIA